MVGECFILDIRKITEQVLIYFRKAIRLGFAIKSVPTHIAFGIQARIMIFRTSMWNFRTENPGQHRGTLIYDKISKLHPQLHPQTEQKPFSVVLYEFYCKKITQLTRFTTKTWCFYKLFGYAEL